MMYKHLEKISTLGMTRTEWLAHRRNHIGGSDASAIIGLNPYSSPYSVWADKLGMLPETPDNEAMRQGRDLEEYVARRFSEATGKRVARVNAILINPDFPFAHANVDRRVVGEDALLECKTTSILNTRLFRGQDFPEKYYAQCVHYLMVTGCARIYLAVLILGTDFKVYQLERDEQEIESLRGAEEEFWRYVEADEAPPVDEKRATADAIAAANGDSDPNAGICDLTPIEDAVRDYLTAKSSVKMAQEQADEAQNRIMQYMGEAGRGRVGRYTVYYQTETRSTFTAKKFAEDHPEMDLSGYYKHTNSRPFKVTEKK